jgi:leader peptidase (prepilin peptidase)/N-methyltransferase
VSRGLQIYLDALVFCFGAAVGSFLNVCVHRMPRDESIVRPRSRCPRCGHQIRWFDNIPLFSWIALRGHCRQCGGGITPRYFLVELLTAVLFLLIWRLYPDWRSPVYWVFLAGLIASTFIDFEHYIIPNELTYGGVIAGIVFSTLDPRLQNSASMLGGFLDAVFGAFVGGGTLLIVAFLGEKIFRKEAMGMGDVKFLAAIGAFLGWQATLFTVFVSSVVGGLVGVILILVSRSNWKARIPYGPYIALGALVWVICGPSIVDWYLSLMRG